MTLQEMKYQFEVGFDAISNFASPGFTDEELSVIFNQAQLRLLKRRLEPKGNKYGLTVEETEKRRKDFSELVSRATCSLSSSQTGKLDANNSFIYDLPKDLLYVLEEHCFINHSTDACIEDGSLASVKPITHDTYMSNIWNPWKRPYEYVLWRLDLGRKDNTTIPTTGNRRRHEIIKGDGYSISSYNITYLRMPKSMDFENPSTSYCELDASIHDEIVEEAIQIAMVRTQDQGRIQVQGQENQLTE